MDFMDAIASGVIKSDDLVIENGDTVIKFDDNLSLQAACISASIR